MNGAASRAVTPDALAEMIVLGPDPDRHLQAIDQFARAGYDHVYVHQVGPDVEGMIRFYEQSVMPRVGQLRATA